MSFFCLTEAAHQSLPQVRPHGDRLVIEVPTMVHDAVQASWFGTLREQGWRVVDVYEWCEFTEIGLLIQVVRGAA